MLKSFFIIGDNEEVPFELYKGATVSWHRRNKEVTIMAVQGDSVLGMELLTGSLLCVEAKPGGRVYVTALRKKTSRRRSDSPD